jgi:hypothetical protein
MITKIEEDRYVIAGLLAGSLAYDVVIEQIC